MELAQSAAKRDATEYRYALELTRKLDNDTYDQQQKTLQKELERLEETKKKEWAEREKKITEQERQYNELKAKVDKFPKELEAAIKKTTEESTQWTQRLMQTKIDLRAKEVDGEQRIFEQKVTSLEDAIQKQAHQIEQLSGQLVAALKQAQDLALKAIEGASNVNSFMAMKEIALEQAKKRSEK